MVMKVLGTRTAGKTLLVTLCLLAALRVGGQLTPSSPANNRTTISEGAILLNGKPFPMVMDAGTDTFTPQEYDLVMGSKDGFGANTWWLQYAMRHMNSETDGDFTGLERALDFFEKTGMWVNLYLRAEYRDLPNWFYQKNNDYQMLGPTGKPVGEQICLQHEGFRRLIDRFLRQAVSVAKSKRSLLMYSVYDEFCIRGWGCYCPRCVAKYREYLQQEYRDIRKLNEAWNSNYDSWHEVDAPRTQAFDPNYGDWQRYRLKVLHDFGMLYYRAVKEEDPDHLVWMDINMDLYGYTWQRLCVWWKLTDIFDAFNLGPDAIAEGGTLRTAMNRAIHDNYRKGATWHRGIFDGEIMYKPEIYSLLFESSHDGLVWWYSYWDVLRTDKVWGAGDEAESPIIGNWFAARKLNHLTQYLGDLYVYSKPVRGEVAVFVSAVTDMLRGVTAKQVLQSEDALDLGGIGQILRDLNIPYEAIGEDQLGKLDSFKALVLGQFSMCADEATAQVIQQYVRRGGTLIVTNYAFSADANGREVANPSFGLDKVWGSSGRVGDQTGEGIIAFSAADPSGFGGVKNGMPFPSLGGVGRRQVRTAQVIAKLADGTPAITLNRYGNGQVLFIGTNAGEAYNTGYLLTQGKYRSDRKATLTVEEYQRLVQRYKGWQNYAILLSEALNRARVQSPIAIHTLGGENLLSKARISLQEHQAPDSGSTNYLVVLTLEPLHDPLTHIRKGREPAAKAPSRILKNLTVTARIPDPHGVKAVYHIPPIGYKMAKIDAIPEKIPFEVTKDQIQIMLPEISDAACLLVARDARPLVGVKTDQVSAQDGKPTRVRVTVECAGSEEISGQIVFTPGFQSRTVGGEDSRFEGLKPGERYSAEFDVTAPSPVERNRTFQATVRYSRQNGHSGSASSYPVTSRTDERIAWGWIRRVEADMAEAATPPTPWGHLYNEALQVRELVYAAYNSGAYADAVRLAKEHIHLCRKIKKEGRK